jgi:hypothetical protein
VRKAPSSTLSPVQLEDVPGPGGMNRWVGVLASLAAVIQALVTLRSAEPDDTGSRQADLDLDAALGAGARTVTRVSRGGTSAAALSSCRRALAVQWVHSLRWELNSVFWIRSTPLARVV